MREYDGSEGMMTKYLSSNFTHQLTHSPPYNKCWPLLHTKYVKIKCLTSWSASKATGLELWSIPQCHQLHSWPKRCLLHCLPSHTHTSTWIHRVTYRGVQQSCCPTFLVSYSRWLTPALTVWKGGYFQVWAHLQINADFLCTRNKYS